MFIEIYRFYCSRDLESWVPNILALLWLSYNPLSSLTFSLENFLHRSGAHKLHVLNSSWRLLQVWHPTNTILFTLQFLRSFCTHLFLPLIDTLSIPMSTAIQRFQRSTTMQAHYDCFHTFQSFIYLSFLIMFQLVHQSSSPPALSLRYT